MKKILKEILELDKCPLQKLTKNNISEISEELAEYLESKFFNIKNEDILEEVENICDNFGYKDVFELSYRHYWADRCAKGYYAKTIELKKENKLLKTALESSDALLNEVIKKNYGQFYKSGYFSEMFLKKAEKELKKDYEKNL